MPTTQKRSNPVDDSPPRVSEKLKKKNQPVACLICDVTIKESTEDIDGDDAIYYDGDCKGWLHRKCVFMSKQLYDKLSNSHDMYYCPNCASAKQSQEITVLKKQVEELTKEITNVEALKQRITDLEKELSVVNANTTSDSPTPSSAPSTTPIANNSSNQQVNLRASPDRRFNLIIQGIPECPPNMSVFNQINKMSF